jgi:hypothetical protein
MRLTHLYTGLFLAPWVLVYAASAFCLNHQPWIVKTFNITPPRWEPSREADFTPDDGFPQEPAAQAQAIVEHLDLSGPHRVLGKPNAKQMIVIRPSGLGNYRITWRKPQKRLIVERQPFSAYRLLHSLHFRGGYRQKFIPHITWAVVVDAVAISMMLWVVSGFYIWLRRPRQRAIGTVCALAGSFLFVVLVVLFCL